MQPMTPCRATNGAGTRRIILVLLGLCCASGVLANPLPTEVPTLRDELERVITSGESGACGKLVELLGRPSYHTFTEQTLAIMRAHMAVLEPCIVASQCRPYALDPSLQAEFRENASQEGIAAMRTVLRARAVLPREFLALAAPGESDRAKALKQADRAMREILPAIELLSDYGDPEDARLLTSLYDTVAAVPAQKLLLRYEGPPSWFIQMAARRCENPHAGAVFALSPDRAVWQLVRSESEITRLELYSHPALGLNWHGIRLRHARVADLLRQLGSSPAREGNASVTGESARLRIYFRDGVTATITAFSDGNVTFEDNSRFVRTGLYVQNRGLARDILELVTG
jgi:hypothetical protein